jgi:hypothetical protein
MEDLKLNGTGLRTQEAYYARRVRKRIEFSMAASPMRSAKRVSITIPLTTSVCPRSTHATSGCRKVFFLQASDIDGACKFIHVHLGKEDKDRYVPLTDSSYSLLR